MNYYGARDLASSFRTVRKNTLTIAQDIPEEKYGFRPDPVTRSVGELLAHISLSYSFQRQIHAQERRTSMAGFDFPALMQRLNAEEKAPRTKEQTLELLRTSGEKWAGWIHFPMISWRSRLPCRRGGGLPPQKPLRDDPFGQRT